MGDDIYRRFRAAAVQAAPVFLDREATIEKVERCVAKAKAVGADLVVFGESYIPAFPLWNMLYAPVDQHAFYRRLFFIKILHVGLGAGEENDFDHDVPRRTLALTTSQGVPCEGSFWYSRHLWASKSS